MIWQVRATFEDGVFVPREPCTAQDGAEFDLRVEGPLVQPAGVTDPAQRKAIFERLADRMKANPLTGNGDARLTRDQLHERR